MTLFHKYKTFNIVCFVLFFFINSCHSTDNNGILRIEGEERRIEREKTTIEENKVNNIEVVVSEWNIGYWNNGKKPYGVLNTEVEFYITEVNELLSCLRSDILVITEYVTFFDRDLTIGTYETLLESYYPYSYIRGDNRPAIFSRFPIKGSTCTFLDGNRTYTKGIISIDGVSVVIVAIHHAAGIGQSESRDKNNRSLIEEYSRDSYVIITGDFNNTSQEELLPYFETGWSVGNGGDSGVVNTYRSNTKELYIDNVITKGFRIDDFQAIYEKESAGVSDHYPVIARLSKHD